VHRPRLQRAPPLDCPLPLVSPDKLQCSTTPTVRFTISTATDSAGALKVSNGHNPKCRYAGEEHDRATGSEPAFPQPASRELYFAGLGNGYTVVILAINKLQSWSFSPGMMGEDGVPGQDTRTTKAKHRDSDSSQIPNNIRHHRRRITILPTSSHFLLAAVAIIHFARASQAGPKQSTIQSIVAERNMF